MRTRIKSVRRDLAELVKFDTTENYKQIVRKSMIRVTSEQRCCRYLGFHSPASPASTVVPATNYLQQGPSITEAGCVLKYVNAKIVKHDPRLTKLDETIHILLFECERLIVSEFIECSVPIFYAMYLWVLFHLPNANFYPETQFFDAVKLSQTVRSIVTYGALEFVSLQYLHLLLYWELKISAMYLLANILE